MIRLPSKFTPLQSRRLHELASRADWLALGVESLLLCIGVAFIYGAGVEVGGELSSKWLHQLIWIAMGFAAYVVIAAIDYRFWCRHGWKSYLLAIALLVYVLLFGKTLNNTRGWMQLPGVGFRLQPVEVAKPMILLFLAWLATLPVLRHSWMKKWLPALLIALATALPVALICLQPDVGTAMVFIPVMLVLVLLVGIPWRYFAIAALAMMLLAPVLYLKMKPYQKDRVNVFIEAPLRGGLDAARAILPEGAGLRLEKAIDRFLHGNGEAADGRRHKPDDWNARQSLLAVGSGGIYGKGYLHGTQHVLGYLPKTIAPTDFIFSVIAEETGFIGSVVLLGLFACLILSFGRTALAAADPLGTHLVAGVIVFFATHIVVNISMTIRAAPIVGIPLPFVSYGGSFMLGTMALAGLVQSVQLHNTPPTADDGENG